MEWTKEECQQVVEGITWGKTAGIINKEESMMVGRGFKRDAGHAGELFW